MDGEPVDHWTQVFQTLFASADFRYVDRGRAWRGRRGCGMGRESCSDATHHSESDGYVGVTLRVTSRRGASELAAMSVQMGCTAAPFEVCHKLSGTDLRQLFASADPRYVD